MKPTRSIDRNQIRHSYAAVYVLLVSWEDDDLGVAEELAELARIFRAFYGFQIEGFLIPSQDQDDVFANVLREFVLRCQSSKSLLIVYYGGHGALNPSRLAHWYCHQRILENSTSDVLLILDCCEALGGGSYIRDATGKQVLAACGFSSETPGVGQHSFSNALIQELQKSAIEPFTIQELHHRLVVRLRNALPDFGAEDRQTPVLENLGEGGFPSPSIRIVSYSIYPINLIALMGATGSGKSSLINRICGADIAITGDGQESTTKEVQHYVTVIHGESLTLIDTPGFDDTYLSDRQVLERIAAYLFDHYRNGRKLNGLLYLRDINIEKMTGTARKNLDLFQRLCGEESLRNVVLLTTKWDKATSLAVGHETELVSKFWSSMIKLGCQPPKRVGNTIDPGLQIIDAISDVIEPMLKYNPTWLQIQRELGKGNDLIDTAAGRYVDQNLSVAISDMKESLESKVKQAEKSKLPEIKALLTEDVEADKTKLEEAKNDKEALKKDFDDVLVSEAQRRSELFGYAVTQILYNYTLELESQGSDFRKWAVAGAAIAMFESCKYIWKKQGKTQSLIQSAKNKMYG